MECLCETWLDHLRISALRITVITLKNRILSAISGKSSCTDMHGYVSIIIALKDARLLFRWPVWDYEQTDQCITGGIV